MTNEIEQLKARIEELESVLQKIADLDVYDENNKPTAWGYFANLARVVLKKD